MTYEKANAIFEELPLLYRVACAIFCTKEIYKAPNWNTYANEWLGGVLTKDSNLLIVEDAPWLAAESFRETISLDARSQSQGARSAARAVEWLIVVLRTSRGRTDEEAAAHWWWSAILLAGLTPTILSVILTTHFVCPYCYKQPSQHTPSGKCLFGAHTWEGINNVWKCNDL